MRMFSENLEIVSTNYQAFVWRLSLESNIRLMYRWEADKSSERKERQTIYEGVGRRMRIYSILYFVGDVSRVRVNFTILNF